jgi:murein DD-endopeptidase MepM/ murein hydrolase activator NlpD
VSYNASNGTNYEVIYGHIKNGTITVNETDSVRAGEILGEMGNTGCSTGKHLHFEVREMGKGNSYTKVDPYDIYNRTSSYPTLANNKTCGANTLFQTCPRTD